MLEANLSSLEKKIEDLLASFEAQEAAAKAAPRDGAGGKEEGDGGNAPREA